MLYYSTLVFYFLLCLGAVLWFIFGLGCAFKRMQRHNKVVRKKLQEIRNKISWKNELDERKKSEFLVVRDYVQLQNNKRAYIEKKINGKKEQELPKSVKEAMKRSQEKQKVRNRLRFEKDIKELHLYKRRIPKCLYLPNPDIRSREESEDDVEEDDDFDRIDSQQSLNMHQIDEDNPGQTSNDKRRMLYEKEKNESHLKRTQRTEKHFKKEFIDSVQYKKKSIKYGKLRKRRLKNVEHQPPNKSQEDDQNSKQTLFAVPDQAEIIKRRMSFSKRDNLMNSEIKKQIDNFMSLHLNHLSSSGEFKSQSGSQSSSQPRENEVNEKIDYFKED
ncbi:UNKNOWN [Stylonychia lemnae]|uniref:Uncharacterized protein n=1 Tax=Stylonychia lemnae TaxID=5949 RepID=A0A078B508_STYLE|nr:UNKNOWN [Stylonychia lemnae]|eukprot:CDW89331.1 UNKNOWN [Stylonychia lemnae]